MIDPDYFVDLVDGKFARTSADNLWTAFTKAKDASNLVVHFHGGLVSREKALDSAAGLLGTYRDAGAYPFFFLWNSDLPATIKGSWDEIPRERAFLRLIQRLAQFAVSKLGAPRGARGGALELESIRQVPREPEPLAGFIHSREETLRRDADDLTAEEQAQLRRELDQDEELRLAAAEVALFEQIQQGRSVATSRGAVPAVRPVPSLMAANVREEIRQDFFATEGEPVGRGTWLLALARHGVAILIAVVRRFKAGRDHGLYTTIIEETLRKLYVDSLGQLAWELMKNDTRDAFHPDPQCGGTAFLEQVAAWWKPGRRITLVGHSTGAIYIGNLLEAADSRLPRETSFEVIFLAAAISFEEMSSKMPYFRRRVGDRIRAFGLGQEREKGYYEVPVLYKGSLLYMVSGLFEQTETDKEIVGMQRYHDDQDVYNGRDVAEVRDYLHGKCYWAECNSPEGCATNAERHGGFAADGLTKQSLSYLLRNGL